ncbi:MAG: hypothetical protein IPO27_12850 [Bacteroidetes bacterium]|nr:hypothetical protein [Bacteroidota bacterium]
MSKIVYTFFFLWLPLAAFAYFDLSPRHEQLLDDIFNMKFDKARVEINYLQKNYPNNFYNHFAEGQMDFLRAFVTEEKMDLDLLIANNDKRIELLSKEATSNPCYSYMYAELLLGKAYNRIKHEQYVTAAFEIKKAFKLLESNYKNHPNFKPTLVNLGLLHCVFSSIPDKYKWVASLIGLEGSLTQGISELKHLIDDIDKTNTNRHLRNEVLVWLIFVETHLNKQERNSLELIKQYKNVYDSPLTVFSVGNVYFHYQQNDNLIKLFENYRQEPGTFPMEYLHYFRGVSYMNKLDQRGTEEFKLYLKNYKGKNYFKGAYQRIAWLALLRGDMQAYQENINYARTHGNEFMDEDKMAKLECERKEIPNLFLLKSRLLFDGGYFDESLKMLAGKNNNDFPTFREKLEYIYRSARLQDELNNKAKALELYLKVIELGKDKVYAHAAFSCVFTGYIYELKKDKVNAKKYYKLCLALPDHDYKNTSDQKAKAGLSRLK